MTRYTLPILLLFFLSIHLSGVAQDSTSYLLDSVRVKKGSYFIIDDQIVQVKNDTVFVFVDSLRYNIGSSDERFYKKLKDIASKKDWSRKLYDFLIIEPDEERGHHERTNLLISSRKLHNHQNKPIRDFHFKQLEVFGPTIDDTARSARLVFERIGNKLHTTTRENTVKENLFLEVGDHLDPEEIQDAERILRELPFIKDARILPIDRLTTGDSVALEIITQDAFAYSFDFRFSGMDGGALGVDYNNFMGLGHQVRNEISYDRDHPEKKVGYGIRYRIPNIRRSFIGAETNFFQNYNEGLVNVAVGREFISPQIDYAGGLDIGRAYSRQRYFVPGTNNEIDTLFSSHNYQDIWFGRAFRVKIGNKELSNRTRLVISGRYNRKHFIERPGVQADNFQGFQHSRLWMGSISLSTRHYFRDRLIYSYGQTEDIPYGQKFTLGTGHEKNEFGDRFFASANASAARFISNWGYFYVELLLESFFRHGKSEQGIINPSINYFSNLKKYGRFQTRHFLSLDFMRGINRFNNEFLSINRENGIRGFSSDMGYGNQRLNMGYELVAFSIANPVGFRIAPYLFYDASVLAQGNDSVFKGSYYHGFGLGCRIRNDNLTFNTLEVRLGIYPNGPEDVSLLGFKFSELERIRFRDFDITAPRVTSFE